MLRPSTRASMAIALCGNGKRLMASFASAVVPAVAAVVAAVAAAVVAAVVASVVAAVVAAVSWQADVVAMMKHARIRQKAGKPFKTVIWS